MWISGDGGRGGDGRTPGGGGEVGVVVGFVSEPGDHGQSGEIDGTGTGWGLDGVDNGAFGGLKGSGIIDGGATVALFGDTPARYINGAGDHP